MYLTARPAWQVIICTLLLGWSSLLTAFVPVHTLPVTAAAESIHAAAESPCHQPQTVAVITADTRDHCTDCEQFLCQQLCHWLTMPGHTALVGVTPPPQTLPERLFYSPLLGHSSRLLRPPQNA